MGEKVTVNPRLVEEHEATVGEYYTDSYTGQIYKMTKNGYVEVGENIPASFKNQSMAEEYLNKGAFKEGDIIKIKHRRGDVTEFDDGSGPGKMKVVSEGGKLKLVDYKFEPDKGIKINENGVIQNVTFNATGDFLKNELQPLANKLRELDKNSTEYAKIKQEYTQKRDSFLRSRKVIQQSEAVIGDMVDNKTYDVDASANYQENGTSNIGFANVLLLKGKRAKDGSYVVQGTDKNGNISYTWVDSTGNVRYKDDGSPWALTENNAFDLLIPKNIEYQANVVALDSASANAGMNGVDAKGNKIEFEDGFQQEYVNSIINSITNSANADQTYKNAIYEQSGLADRNYVEALHAVKPEGGTYTHDETLFNKVLWDSLDVNTWDVGPDGIRGTADDDGKVDAQDFQTADNYKKLVRHLQTFSPENAKIFANWKSLTSGKKEYDDGYKRRKQETQELSAAEQRELERQRLLRQYGLGNKLPEVFGDANRIINAWESDEFDGFQLPGGTHVITSKEEGGQVIYNLTNIKTGESELELTGDNAGLQTLLEKFGKSGQTPKDWNAAKNELYASDEWDKITFGSKTTVEPKSEEIKTKLSIDITKSTKAVSKDLTQYFNRTLPIPRDANGNSTLKITAFGMRGKRIKVTLGGVEVGKYNVNKDVGATILEDLQKEITRQKQS